ncbi:DUF2264 domain-containing protein [Pedobacter sp. SYSU D00535]|uniref:DUF2264 domain-containing protein n=1 Tax=Pedobacter sp. SYSU D00535 TaxID=2810308 RepID=UPI001A95A066|nr:DUF2264 domain-containing protein [Pedobacter sp. SYSU D00535]
MKQLVLGGILLFVTPVFAQIDQKQQKVFDLKQPDFQLSPQTGMARQHWKDAARYLLEGAFSYVKQLDDPMKFPKQPGKSYPRDPAQVPTELLEGLCRTLFIAAPLLREDPTLTINNIRVADYYRHHIAKLIDPSSPTYIKSRAPKGGPSQNLVEFGALAISLSIVPDLLWEPLTPTQKQALSSTMISYGDGPTVPSNWKFFNIFVLSFFKDKGYSVNEPLLKEYLDKSLAHYRGEGWYNDNPAYDYYSMWAFQMYGVLWSEMYGKKYYPEYAAKFKSNFRDVKDNYPFMFSRNGEMIMWGRSIAYRFGSVIPLPLMGFEQGQDTNFGWMRRISSGVLLQFLKHPDFLHENVPTLGFYGAFEPAVQAYSCRASSYWMGKAFLALLIPADNPFWTARENEGPWEKEFRKDQVYNKFQKGSDILITDYPSIGAAEIRAWCKVPVINNWESFRGSENYNRLAYNSAFPWQADGEDGQVAMNYVFKNKDNKWEAARLFTFKKYEDGVYYRDVVLETDKNVSLSLADIPLPNGILRVDKNTSKIPVNLRLGHYSLPETKGTIKRLTKKVQGREVQIIDNGEYQLALVPVAGWDKTETVLTEGLHPETKRSAVINVSDSFRPEQEPLYATLMLWKKSGEQWKDAELNPLKALKVAKDGSSVSISFKNGEEKLVKY